MDSSVPFAFAFLVILSSLAYSDLKTRKLKDVELALLWFSLVIPAMLQPELTPIVMGAAGLGFAWIYGVLYAFPIQILKKPLIRGGDVIIFPPFFAYLCGMFGMAGGYAGLAFTGLILMISYKKEQPVAFAMFIFAFVLTIVSFLKVLYHF
jgi:hypothetical protein